MEEDKKKSDDLTNYYGSVRTRKKSIIQGI
jgi:hypothetical protein